MTEWLQFNLGQFSHFHFLRPWWLLVVVPLFFALRFLWDMRNPMNKWAKAISPQLFKAMLVNHGRSSWFNPVTVGIVALALGVIALAGPSWKQQASPFSKDIAALVIALDTSSSMEQSDVQPSRLERAKLKIQDLLALRPGGRVGLIVYSGSAHSVIPLTNDPDVVNNFLNAINTKMMPRKGKFPEKTLPIAQKMLSDSSVPGTVLIIGDGVGSQTRAEFQQYFSAHPHQLLVFGMGTESSENSLDNATLIPLESAILKKLASENSGFYQSLTMDKEDVQRLNRRINNYLVIVEDGNLLWVDAGYFLLFPLALLLLLWFRKGWTLHWCFALVVVSALTSPQTVMAGNSSFTDRMADGFMALWLTSDQQGRYYMEKGDYKKAATKFESIIWRGIAYYRDENFKAAQEMFSRIETADGYFNWANALAQGRHYILAVKAYNEVLKIEPEHTAAIKNRNQIQSIIDEINLLSASQQAENSDSSKELEEGEPQTAEGVERQDFVKREVEQLTAEQILLDEQMNETWMRQVQKNPSRFLSVKFQMQLQHQADAHEN